MNTEPLYTQGQDDGDARGHPELINTVQKVSKWRGRPRIAKRDQLSQLSMFNFPAKNSGVWVHNAQVCKSAIQRKFAQSSLFKITYNLSYLYILSINIYFHIVLGKDPR